MGARKLILSVFFLCVSACIAYASKVEMIPLRQPLAGLPLQVGSWRGANEEDFSDKVTALLGASDYLNRTYSSNDARVGLYIGFYESQRQGSAIHSPLNCLPGAGWNPAERSYLSVPVESAAGEQHTIEVNRILIEKAGGRQIVLYWYQSHGRVVASEYWGKAYFIWDAIQLNRTDGALVRIISPVLAPGKEAEAAAERAALNLTQQIFPLLSRHLPE